MSDNITDKHMGCSASVQQQIRTEGGIECVHGPRWPANACSLCQYSMSSSLTHLADWSTNVQDHSECPKWLLHDGLNCKGCHCGFCGKYVSIDLERAGSHPECWIRWKKEKKPLLSPEGADVITRQIGWRYKRLASRAFVQ